MLVCIISFFKKVTGVVCALAQLIGWAIFPLEYSGDQVKPDVENPLAKAVAYKDRAAAQAAGGGWYEVLIDEFDYQNKTELEKVWDYSLHGNRNQEWWCPQAVRLQGG
ncbi:MAG: hypothetical protein LBB50_03860, partial [Oscillospiraceae bacterium]|nr:hypothetical protein [Oscillospiraceae bacterium]